MFKLIKKMFYLAVILLFVLLSCTVVNEKVGSIVFTNTSDKDAKNIQIGSYKIGNISSGQSYTYYFYQSESDLGIDVDGFSPDLTYNPRTDSYVTAKGRIYLQCNYIYKFEIYKNIRNVYVYNISGEKVSGGKNDKDYYLYMD